MSETALAVLLITAINVVCCACLLLIFWKAPDTRINQAPQAPVDDGQAATGNISGRRKPGMSNAAAKPDVDPKAERRNAAITFIGFLIALAYQEAVSPVQAALKAGEFTSVTAGLVSTFFFLGLSTFFGGFYHFLVAPWKGVGWVCNFLIVVLSAVILVFMAGVCTEEASTSTAWGMFRWTLAYSLLMAVWALAIFAWLASSHGLRAIRGSTRQSLADTFVAAALVALIFFGFSDQYSTVPALLLAAVAVVRFGRALQILIREGMI